MNFKHLLSTWYGKLNTLAKLAVSASLIGVILTAIAIPLTIATGFLINRKLDTPKELSQLVISGKMPTATTLVDNRNRPFAFIYSQRRFPLTYSQIPENMERAIISIEDRRFYQHDGADWTGTLRAALKIATSGTIEQGGSTLDQQYVKNFLLHVAAKNKAEEQAAVENTTKRKLRETQLAIQLERSLKNKYLHDYKVSPKKAKLMAKHEILTRYLNLVPFGNGAYGIEAAALTYFGIKAPQLTAEQAAMLAGMVQSSSRLNPFSNAEKVLERRNIVLYKMAKQYPDKAKEYLAAVKTPLSILPKPKIIPSGCIGAGKNAFFCDYVVDVFDKAGITYGNLLNNGYYVKTTLDSSVQNSASQAVKNNTDPNADNVATVMDVIAPGKNSRKVLAMVSSRKYGLHLSKHETIQPQTFSMEGDGAGSIFKIFTVAAAMEKGLGTDAVLSVPPSYQAKGVGEGGYSGCPPKHYCVKNVGQYRSSMTLTQALATSPNTPFVRLIESTGVAPVVDMAVKLGLRSLADPNSAQERGKPLSLANLFKKETLGSFTLGPTPVNPLELTNVAATLASDGWWCPPNPIEQVLQPKRDKFAMLTMDPQAVTYAMEPIQLATSSKCQQVVSKGLANTLSVALSADAKGSGTSAAAAANAGWNYPVSAKTGTTETHRSAAFLGYTNHVAATVYTFSDTATPTGVCSYPVRSCGDGNLYGGAEPATTWYQTMTPLINKSFPVPKLPPPDQHYQAGVGAVTVPNIVGLNYANASSKLKKLGFKVDVIWGPGYPAQGIVTGQDPVGKTLAGNLVKVYVSNGVPPVTKQPKKSPKHPKRGKANNDTIIRLPGLPPIVIPRP